MKKSDVRRRLLVLFNEDSIEIWLRTFTFNKNTYIREFIDGGSA